MYGLIIEKKHKNVHKYNFLIKKNIGSVQKNNKYVMEFYIS